jgi:hypothetical protein
MMLDLDVPGFGGCPLLPDHPALFKIVGLVDSIMGLYGLSWLR